MAPRTASRRSQITRPSASCWSTTTKPAVTQLSEWIKRQEWEPIAVKDGNAAIEHIYDGVAVIVTDLKMPRTDGMELLRLAKKQAPSWPRLCGGSRDTHHGFWVLRKIRVGEFVHHVIHEFRAFMSFSASVVRWLQLRTPFDAAGGVN